MITLGIETSCDETSCAILENGDKILSNIISSSLEKHQPFGGVVPEIASRHALENIQFVFDEALAQAGKRIDDIDLISVTRGPGLIGSLLVGISFAKALSFSKKIRFVGVNHLEAHLEANLIAVSTPPKSYIGLIVSGGHTLLVRFQNGKYEKLGGTIDDAVGEAYDKAAKLMGLGYPGGPILDQLASVGDYKRFKFTKPKIDGEFDFSFSGIKTAVLHLVRDLGQNLEKEIPNIAASFQHTVIGWLVDGVRRVYEKTEEEHVLIGGGVSANSLLRSRLKELGAEMGITVYIPPISLTVDNAAMIARLGYDKFKQGISSEFDMSASPNLKIGL
ncbi:MAG: tRNA (adenosine(37)-N6)-threonylcarbamoyltransferase complex transferase subunit TsaD [Candidatus Omnitrophica bacterium]|nr:tRNA (adenosine(37)-N6)-threonylcarbamoyltransferase complex transferase subunit TsaD [Candidatus Omnitrophota bacterium]